MLDKFWAYRSLRQHPSFEKHYSPNDAVTKIYRLNPEASKLAVVFPPYNSSDMKTYRRFLHRLAQNDYYVISLGMHGNILEPNVNRVKESFLYIASVAQKEITKSLEDKSFNEIHLFGFSIGNIPMAIVATSVSNFTHATIVTGASSHAETVFNGIRTVNVKDSLIKSGVTLETLRKKWEVLSPKTHASAFRGKNVRLEVSKYDKYIPLRYQLELKSSLEESGANLTSTIHRTGHIVTNLTCMLFMKV